VFQITGNSVMAIDNVTPVLHVLDVLSTPPSRRSVNKASEDAHEPQHTEHSGTCISDVGGGGKAALF
jgi:hypothetical protein